MLLPAVSAQMIELQAHSTVSDGELSPAGVVAAAAAAGVTVLALTDHDAVEGVPEADDAARSMGVRLIPAVELSSVSSQVEELHVLGYGIDLETIAATCQRAQGERRSRATEMVERLNAAGVQVRYEDVVAEAGDAWSIGRPHIARAAGAIDMKAFFEAYLVPGAPTFVPRRWPRVTDAVAAIHEAGGVAVFAHPFWDIDDEALVEEVVEESGFDGIECFYPSHEKAQAGFLVDLCRRRGLLMTASSDFHGPGHKTFARFAAYDTFGLAEPDLPQG